MKNDTIFAPITSINGGSVCVIRISGNNIKDCCEIFGINFAKLKPNSSKFFRLKRKENNELIDESIVTFFKSPNSFTGEDIVEISIHSSKFIFQEIANILIKNKLARFAEPGEFSKRAFMNNKINLLEAEAIPDLIACETEMQHKQAINQLSGHFTKKYSKLRENIINISALIEAFIDFPDEDIPDNIIDEINHKIFTIKQEIKNIINDAFYSQKIKKGLNLVIIGEPNVGKSTLINLLTNSDLAIVSEIAGTTRDIVETNLNICGIMVKIADTAGIRKSTNIIEKEGIKRAIKKAKQSDIKILIIDPNKRSQISKELENLIDDETIILVNKIDLMLDNDVKISKKIKNKPIFVSLKNKTNIDEFKQALKEKVKSKIPNIDSAIITNERHHNCLKNALNYLEDFNFEKEIELAAEDIRLACIEIGKITGKIDVENILDVIFSSFCIGK